MKMVNLDLLKAESVKIKFLEKEFEIGYIPSGLAIPLLDNHNQNVETQKEDDPPEKLFHDTVRSVSLFCSFFHPEFTEEYLLKNATAQQINAMYQSIVYAILTNFTSAIPNDGEDDTGEVTEKKTTGEK
ncbi:hypothetical protein DWQ65_03150 [Treponema phagedenis]|uniref:Uncharacterized protein n=1 Tax=Treponema phagedenis TaxID=162 RepID=A0A0B7GZW2_TREPH|nr:hypothetical protein [Treponema phagedenis]EFW38985.1 hypothetical protein HMPREF9554_00508 [Treponema phagedenis F0421]NVP25571.1 hypothetical protein [Treponema phagedenis]QEJ96132.1 hypothetical protein FUT79_13595 [Treponema phagedenis]QEJ97429.1 hypothetical protein FUT82_05060 [Treponema phagedenis]QEK02094.1 hypothetical protein FUT84_13605 [Treponema phagedenis]